MAILLLHIVNNVLLPIMWSAVSKQSENNNELVMASYEVHSRKQDSNRGKLSAFPKHDWDARLKLNCRCQKGLANSGGLNISPWLVDPIMQSCSSCRKDPSWSKVRVVNILKSGADWTGEHAVTGIFHWGELESVVVQLALPWARWLKMQNEKRYQSHGTYALFRASPSFDTKFDGNVTWSTVIMGFSQARVSRREVWSAPSK